MRKYLLVCLAALMCSAQAWAAEVKVTGAWVRATAPGQSGTVLQFSITSAEDAYLVGIATPVAGTVEMHSMVLDSGVMKMRPIKSLPLPAGRQVELASSGNHVMLLNLKQPLKEGDTIPVTLTVKFTDMHKEKISVKAEVKPLTTSSESHEHHDHH